MRLKELRVQNGQTQKQMAEIIRYSIEEYARYEKGQREPNLKTLCVFADYFGVTLDYLVGRV